MSESQTQPKQDFESKLKRYRLTPFEFEKICSLLHREPNETEWALFSALWSEHCSYKSSKIHLRRFSYRNAKTPMLDGENAGLVDLGQGEKIIFKMESHNHPSFIEPYQGAATGVGGILRDIFTMGARPIALANYLCFGDLEAPRMKEIVRGVVAGIAGYGNCVGVPMLTGATHFSSRYNQNVLVNAMAVGLITDEMPMALSQAQGSGNLVVYVGAKTGRDGVHGASMASESFGLGEGSDKKEIASKKVNIQIGDPFLEKLLIESCLEVLDQKLVVAMQDMGAAGLISSSFEMASKGQVGMDLILDQVPLRDQNMVPEEILLSESQERMLLVVEPKNLKALQKVFHKWGLDAVSIGQIIPQRKMRIQWRGEWLTEIDPDLLTENAPKFEREFAKEALEYDFKKAQLKPNLKPELQKITELRKNALTQNTASPAGDNKNARAQNKNLSPALLPKNFIFEQYDQRVGAATAQDCSESVGVVVLPKSNRYLYIGLGCRPNLMKLSSRFGAMDALLQPYLQMAIKGGEALAVTDCLNFGNPEKIFIMTEFVSAVQALAQGAEILETPVISGNVSFYNETKSENIIPTPALGVVGLGPVASTLAIPSDYFKKSGQKVFHIDLTEFVFDPYFAEFAFESSSELQKESFKNSTIEERAKMNFVGELNFPRWKLIAEMLRQLSQKVTSSFLVSQFGLKQSLLHMSAQGLGVQVKLEVQDLVAAKSKVAELYQFVIACDQAPTEIFTKLEAEFGGKITELGSTVSNKFSCLDLKIDNLGEFQLEQKKQLGGLLEVMA